MLENWNAASGFEGFYEVSDLGRVRSVPMNVHGYGGRMWHSLGKIRKQGVSGKGYRQVHLSCDGNSRVVAVHVLIAAAFLGQRPIGMTVNHIDEIRKRLTNGEKQAVLVKELGVSRSLISQISLGQIWTHVRS